MSLDYDDYLLSGHTGHSAVQVPLAFAETLDEVLVAAAAANEVMGRLSTSCLFGPLNGQMSSYIHCVGAAVALGKVLRLGPRRMAAAMALSLSQPVWCLTPGFWHESAKTLTASSPLLLGLRAAKLAAAGVEGPKDVLEHRLGFWSVYAFAAFPGFFEGLGEVWFSDTLCFKRFPGTSYISAAVEAALEACGGRRCSAEDIDGVLVATTLLSSTLDAMGETAIERSPLDLNAVNFSLRLSVATALCSGSLGPDDLRPEVLVRREEQIRALARKIEVVHDWSQSLRLLSTSPVGATMLARLGPRGLWRLGVHVARLRGSGDGGARGTRRWLVNPASAAALASGLFFNTTKRVTAKDLDLTMFKMYQSAKLELRSGGRVRRVEVDIPVGASGRPWAETLDVVRDRCRETFGAGGDRLWEILWEGGGTVAQLGRAVL